MRMLLIPVAALLLAGPAGCGEFMLRDLRCEVEAGEVIRPDPESKPVWQEQIQVKNETAVSLHDVRVIINPEAIALDGGYRFKFEEPLEPGASPRIPLTEFRNKAGKPFPVGELKIVSVRVESTEGSKSFAGTTSRRRFNQLDFLP